MEVKVNVLNSSVEIPKELVNAADGDELIARIFFNRGYKNPETVRQMLHEDYYSPVETKEFPGISVAVERIVRAIEARETIAVYGDYDVDGVTSTVTLVQCLEFFSNLVEYHVPDRFTEGYGMNSEVIGNFTNRGVSLIITCDCGISNADEIKLAKELGMDVIVTDHHNIPDKLPPADVVLNPKLLEEGHRARNISGCAMAYFLCLALLEHFDEAEKAKEFLDLLALSLVADVVSLNGENRYLLRKAMPRLFSTARPGLKALFSLIEKDVKMHSEEDIAFQLAPRINAAGRMESARLPVDLFLCRDPELCMEMAQKIDFLNKERKRLQQEIIDQAADLVESRKKNKTVLVLFNEYWHHGIIGIAAGKICEMYRKPAVLLTMRDDGVTAVGSARSVEEIDIYRLIKDCSGKLLKFGGHSAAAGLSLKKQDIEIFAQEIEQLAEEKYYIKDKIEAKVDLELEIDDINEGFLNRLNCAGPYGEGFEAPLFVSRDISVLNDRKTEKNHHIMVLTGTGEARISAVKWFGGSESLQGKVFDLTYKIGRSNYRGSSDIQLTVDYLIPSSGKPKDIFSGELIDLRGKNIEEIIKLFEDYEVFYEGLNSACSVKGTVDRYNIIGTQTLIFLSTPANTSVFREAVSLANPDKIILNFSIIPDYSFKAFMLNLLGLLKYIANNKEGKTRIEFLAARLCVEENILRAVLKYLKALGKLDYSIDSDFNSLNFYICNKNPDRSFYALEKNIKDALAEKNAYQQFILKLDKKKFKEYLK